MLFYGSQIVYYAWEYEIVIILLYRITKAFLGTITRFAMFLLWPKHCKFGIMKALLVNLDQFFKYLSMRWVLWGAYLMSYTCWGLSVVVSCRSSIVAPLPLQVSWLKWFKASCPNALNQAGPCPPSYNGVRASCYHILTLFNRLSLWERSSDNAGEV